MSRFKPYTFLGLVGIYIAAIYNLVWVWGILILVWLIPDIRSGRIDVLPRDPDACAWCRYRDLCLAAWGCWRNYVRRRFNPDKESPAQMLGFVDRRMTEEELLSWRQDWRGRSIHPLERKARSIQQVQGRSRAA